MKLQQKNLLVERCQKLNDKSTDFYTFGQWVFSGRAIFLNTGYVKGNGDTHSTVAFFPGGIPKRVLKFLDGNFKRIINEL